LIPGSA